MLILWLIGYLHKIPWSERISELTYFCGRVLLTTMCRNIATKLKKLAAFYYTSVLIIMLCIWQSQSQLLILCIVVCTALVSHWRDNHCIVGYNKVLTAAQLNQMHLIWDKYYIHDIWTGWNVSDVSEITCNLPDRKKSSLVKDLNTCRQDASVLMGYGKWNLNL